MTEQKSALEGSVPMPEQPMPEQAPPAPSHKLPDEKTLKEAARKAALANQEGAEQPEPEPEKPTEDWEGKYQKLLVNYGKQDVSLRTLQERMKSLEEQANQAQALSESLKDPAQALSLLEQHGVGYSDLTNTIVSQVEDPLTPEQKTIQALEQKIAAMEQYQKQQEEAVLKQQAATDYQARISYADKFIANNKEKYPLLHGLQKSAVLVDEYSKALQELGPNPPNVPDEHEVAAKLEQDYRRSVEQNLSRVAQQGAIDEYLKKLGYVKGSTMVPGQPEQQTPVQPADNGQQPTAAPVRTTPTLTNDMSATPDEGFDYHKVLRDGGPNRDRILRERARRVAGQKGVAPNMR